MATVVFITLEIEDGVDTSFAEERTEIQAAIVAITCFTKWSNLIREIRLTGAC